jgi:thiol:disulfide interchange protein DsbD
MKKMVQLLSFVFLIYGASLFIGLLSGSTSLLHPFKQFTSGTVVNAVAEPTKVAKVGYSIESLQKEVEASSNLVMVDFRKKSCASCDELEEFTFPDPAVKEELKRFTFIKVDVTNNTKEEKALMTKFGAFGTPSIIFFDKNNTLLPSKSVAGFIKAEKFAKHLKTIH